MDTPALTIPVSSPSIESNIRKSRFIAQVHAVETSEEARVVLSELREHHPSAAHIVYAFRVGGFQRDEFGMSDDGEPKGTAGRPVLEVLRGSAVTNVLVSVVRYFGGTKLGTGGLVRAYTQAAQDVLQKLETRELEQRVSGQIHCEYNLHPSIIRALEELCDHGVRVEDEVFDVAVTVWVSCRADARTRLDSAVRDVSRGTIEVAYQD